MKGFSDEHPLKLLWLSNVPLPGAFSAEEGKVPVICGWVNSLAEKLKHRPDIRLSVLYPQELSRETRIRQAEGIKHIGFYEPADPLLAYPEWLEASFRQILEEEKPELIHIWGTEYVHSLALFRAFGHPERVLISIQGLISVYAEHYFAEVPEKWLKAYTLRDLVHRDNLVRQQKKYVLRGGFEQSLLKEARHVAGRTSWDSRFAKELAPDAQYHHCDEILRDEFYAPPCWRYEGCARHSVFASQFYYPIKGFHRLLLAMPEVLRDYPDATIRVSGGGIIFPRGLKGRLRKSAYPKYLERLIRALQLKDRVEFLGNLDAAGMKREYLRANVFVLPSAIENSPNSLAEAMLSGTPAVSAEVGGVGDMLGELGENALYPFSDTALLAQRIKAIFRLGAEAESLSQRESAVAGVRHDPERCLMQYLEAYGRILE